MAGERIDYRDGDTVLAGELFRPAGLANGRAVLVVHEADGLGQNVRRRCAMLADLGYVALAADLYGGGRVLEGDAMTRAVEDFRNAPGRFRRRVAAGVEALGVAASLGPERIAAIGYCFGGMGVLELARAGSPVRAVASFHGLLTTRAPAERGAVRAKVAAFTGARDPLVPPADIAAFQAEMATAEADWQVAVYGRALHSFTNPAVDAMDDARMAYDAAADRQSWAAALRFMDEAFGA